MRSNRPLTAGAALLALLLLAPPELSRAQEVPVDFDSERWVSDPGSQVVEHLGRRSLKGGGELKDAVFENGVIEVDVAVDGTRSFLGIYFRVQSPTEGELFYLRPHRSGEPVALQYLPVFNGVDGWQLYTGLGATAAAEISTNRWLHVRLEVSGTQARAYLDGSPDPALIMHDLRHGVSRGAIGLFGQPTGQYYFSNLKYRTDDSVKFPPAPPLAVRPGLITKWQISQAFLPGQVNRAQTPEAQRLPAIDWREVETEPSGLLNVNKWVAPAGPGGTSVFARTTIQSEREETKRLSFGYSDLVTVLLNGAPLFTGDATYRSRDPLFYGAVGLQDSVYLDLKRGPNELVFILTDSMGGCGLMARLDDVRGEAVWWHPSVSKEWEAARVFEMPESVLYDARRDVLYVSNFARPASPGQDASGFVSRLKVDGTIESLKWIPGLNRPTGMALHGDTLFIVERGGLTEADAGSGKIVRRTRIEGARFPNDVAVDSAGIAYVSDFAGNAIYKVANGSAEIWLKGPEISAPNGLYVDGNRLIIGNSGDQCLKAADLATRVVTSIVRLGPGTIGGIEPDGRGRWIVSHSEGEVYRIDPAGVLETLLDTRAGAAYAADFEYILEKRLLVVPTFIGGGVSAYRIGGGR